MEGSSDSLSVMTPSMGGSPAVLLTPGRTRNIAQDMEALRLSRQDNPYLQHVMASRESLIESHAEECGSDDTILMSQEFGSAGLDFTEDDPLTLKEVHEHMIRSPPPTSCWPHGSATSRAASAFEFAESALHAAFAAHSSHSAHSAHSAHDKEAGSRRATRRARSSRSVSPRSHETALGARPLSLPGEGHLRSALGKRGLVLGRAHSGRAEEAARLVPSKEP